MYCICNPLPHLARFSSFLTLVFSTVEGAYTFFSCFGTPSNCLLRVHLLALFLHFALFFASPLSHTECKLCKMMFFTAVLWKWDQYFLILFCGFHILYCWHKRMISVEKHGCLFMALLWVELHFRKVGAVCAAVRAQPQYHLLTQKVNFDHFLLWDEFFRHWLASCITWSKIIFVSISK